MTRIFQYFRISLFSLLLLPLTWGSNGWTITHFQQAIVCGVHDGDTLKTCAGQSIRLWGIDAPELKQPHGPLAQQALRTRLLGEHISLECKSKSYQRNVCTVFKNGEEINAWMVLHGFAYDSPQYSHKYYAVNEWLARTLHLGIWMSPLAAETPWHWRRQKHNRLSLVANNPLLEMISEYHFFHRKLSASSLSRL